MSNNKMLNYIKLKCLLTKMVSLKRGVGRFGGVRGFMDEQGVWQVLWGKIKHPMWDHSYQLRLCMPPSILCGMV